MFSMMNFAFFLHTILCVKTYFIMNFAEKEKPRNNLKMIEDGILEK